MRMTLAYNPPLPTSSPRSLVLSSSKLIFSASGAFPSEELGSTISSACIRPIPRTSPMDWCFSCKTSSPERSRSPCILALEGRPAPFRAGGFAGETPVHRRRPGYGPDAVSYTHLRAHETDSYLVCRLLL